MSESFERQPNREEEYPDRFPQQRAELKEIEKKISEVIKNDPLGSEFHELNQRKWDILYGAFQILVEEKPTVIDDIALAEAAMDVAKEEERNLWEQGSLEPDQEYPGITKARNYYNSCLDHVEELGYIRPHRIHITKYLWENNNYYLRMKRKIRERRANNEDDQFS